MFYNLSKIWLVFILFVKVCSYEAYGLKDSTEPDTSAIRFMIDKAFQLAFSHTDSAIYYADSALKISGKIGYDKGRYDAVHTKGVAFYAADKYDSALNCFYEAVTYRSKSGDLQGLASTYNNIALVFSNLSIYEQAVKYNLEALKIREKINDTEGISKSLNNIGMSYHYLNEYQKALRYYKKALEYKYTLKDSFSIASTLNNIGQLFFDWDSESEQYYDSASLYLIKAIRIRESIKDLQGYSETLLNLGNLYIQRKQFDPALIFVENSIRHFSQVQDKFGLANAYYNKGIIYRNKSGVNARNAADQFYSSLSLAKQINNLDLMKDCYFNLYEINKNSNRTDKAIEYLELFNAIKDSILSVEKQKEIMKLQVLYETEKNEKLIISQKSIIERLISRQTILYIVIGIMVLLVSGAFIIRRR